MNKVNAIYIPTIVAYLMLKNDKAIAAMMEIVPPIMDIINPFVKISSWLSSSKANRKIAANTFKDINGTSIAVVVVIMSDIPKSDGDSIFV